MPDVIRSFKVSAYAAVVALVATAATACSSGDKAGAGAADTAAAPTASAAATPAQTDTMKGMSGMNMGSAGTQGSSMAGMQMTGDPDHDFLRMMSDHHKGMIAMAHMTKEQKPAPGSAADATKLDTKQDAELDKMMTMLEKEFKDPYSPKVMPDNQAMVDQLRGKTGADYDRTFYQNVVMHHQQAIKMIDDYLPKAKSATLKQMAEKMKADQTKEIAEFQKKAAAAK